jgi:hypothetical protein
MAEVGDAVELTYTTAPGASVVATWTNPAGTKVLDAVPVTESSTVPGDFPYVFVGTAAGTWRATFTASGAAVQVDEFEVLFEVLGGPLPLATVGEYVAIYGELNAARTATCKALLRRASALVRGAYPAVDSKITDGTADAALVGQVVLNMAARALRNPGGLRAETVGPISRTYDTGAASGLLALTDDDRGLLLSAGAGSGTGRNRRRVGSIRTAGGMVPPSCPRDVWPGGNWRVLGS